MKNRERIGTWTHWIVADPYKMSVISVVGNPSESAEEKKLPPDIKRILRDVIPSDVKCCVMKDWVTRKDKKRMFCDTGTCQREGQDVFVWFPAFPTLPTLIHELDHAAHFILSHCGVEEIAEKNEAHAYLLTHLAEHFIGRFSKDIKKEGLSWL